MTPAVSCLTPRVLSRALGLQVAMAGGDKGPKPAMSKAEDINDLLRQLSQRVVEDRKQILETHGL